VSSNGHGRKHRSRPDRRHRLMTPNRCAYIHLPGVDDRCVRLADRLVRVVPLSLRQLDRALWVGAADPP